ncbi:histone lysine methyltransferase SET2 [Babesia caballi]|uniref:Histone lysine methyltransferase SET2 n=1 Tax=Babesia caballi TaxID=5871 RepID=A0AAV4LMI4_BABCB|nr:histone lysine methyltransferase SET2 [Babesia caballi]
MGRVGRHKKIRGLVETLQLAVLDSVPSEFLPFREDVEEYLNGVGIKPEACEPWLSKLLPVPEKGAPSQGAPVVAKRAYNKRGKAAKGDGSAHDESVCLAADGGAAETGPGAGADGGDAGAGSATPSGKKATSPSWGARSVLSGRTAMAPSTQMSDVLNGVDSLSISQAANEEAAGDQVGPPRRQSRTRRIGVVAEETELGVESDLELNVELNVGPNVESNVELNLELSLESDAAFNVEVASSDNAPNSQQKPTPPSYVEEEEKADARRGSARRPQDRKLVWPLNCWICREPMDRMLPYVVCSSVCKRTFHVTCENTAGLKLRLRMKPVDEDTRTHLRGMGHALGAGGSKDHGRLGTRRRRSGPSPAELDVVTGLAAQGNAGGKSPRKSNANGESTPSEKSDGLQGADSRKRAASVATKPRGRSRGQAVQFAGSVDKPEPAAGRRAQSVGAKASNAAVEEAPVAEPEPTVAKVGDYEWRELVPSNTGWVRVTSNCVSRECIFCLNAFVGCSTCLEFVPMDKVCHCVMAGCTSFYCYPVCLGKVRLIVPDKRVLELHRAIYGHMNNLLDARMRPIFICHSHTCWSCYDCDRYSYVWETLWRLEASRSNNDYMHKAWQELRKSCRGKVETAHFSPNKRLLRPLQYPDLRSYKSYMQSRRFGLHGVVNATALTTLYPPSDDEERTSFHKVTSSVLMRCVRCDRTWCTHCLHPDVHVLPHSAKQIICQDCTHVEMVQSLPGGSYDRRNALNKTQNDLVEPKVNLTSRHPRDIYEKIVSYISVQDLYHNKVGTQPQFLDPGMFYREPELKVPVIAVARKVRSDAGKPRRRGPSGLADDKSADSSEEESGELVEADESDGMEDWVDGAEQSAVAPPGKTTKGEKVRRGRADRDANVSGVRGSAMNAKGVVSGEGAAPGAEKGKGQRRAPGLNKLGKVGAASNMYTLVKAEDPGSVGYFEALNNLYNVLNPKAGASSDDAHGDTRGEDDGPSAASDQFAAVETGSSGESLSQMVADAGSDTDVFEDVESTLADFDADEGIVSDPADSVEETPSYRKNAGSGAGAKKKKTGKVGRPPKVLGNGNTTNGMRRKKDAPKGADVDGEAAKPGKGVRRPKGEKGLRAGRGNKAAQGNGSGDDMDVKRRKHIQLVSHRQLFGNTRRELRTQARMCLNRMRSKEFNIMVRECNPLTVLRLCSEFRYLTSNIITDDSLRSAGSVEPGARCHCTVTCFSGCMNKARNVECNNSNCSIGENCGNRRFKQLGIPKLRLREVEGKGIGAFAAEDILEDELVCEYVGKVITQGEFQRCVSSWSFAELDNANHSHWYIMKVHRDVYIDSTNVGNVARFINHSCNPNCSSVPYVVNGTFRMGVFAHRKIEKGEEVTYNYGFSSRGVGGGFKCLCGAANCRGIVGVQPDKTTETLGKIEYAKAEGYEYETLTQLMFDISAMHGSRSDESNMKKAPSPLNILNGILTTGDLYRYERSQTRLRLMADARLSEDLALPVSPVAMLLADSMHMNNAQLNYAKLLVLGGRTIKEWDLANTKEFAAGIPWGVIALENNRVTMAKALESSCAFPDFYPRAKRFIQTACMALSRRYAGDQACENLQALIDLTWGSTEPCYVCGGYGDCKSCDHCGDVLHDDHICGDFYVTRTGMNLCSVCQNSDHRHEWLLSSDVARESLAMRLWRLRMELAYTRSRDVFKSLLAHRAPAAAAPAFGESDSTPSRDAAAVVYLRPEALFCPRREYERFCKSPASFFDGQVRYHNQCQNAVKYYECFW